MTEPVSPVIKNTIINRAKSRGTLTVGEEFVVKVIVRVSLFAKTLVVAFSFIYSVVMLFKI